MSPPWGWMGKEGRRFSAEIRELRRRGKTLVIVSHQVENLLGLIDRVIVLDRGRIFAAGTPTEVFSFLLRVKKFLFLVPPIYQLLAELKEEGWNIPEPLFTPEDALPILERNLPVPARP